MKTIEQLQSELRDFAADMNSELEQLKEQRADSTLTADFPKLSASASRYPIERHPLESQDEHTQKCYITLLLTVARFEPEMLSESLLFAHRVAFGMYYLAGGEDLKDEFLSSQTLTFEQLDEVTNLFRKSELRLMLIEECLLMAGVFDKGRKAAFEYIAQLAVMLNVDKEELTMLSNMAAVILTEDVLQSKCQIDYNSALFSCYLKKLELQCSRIEELKKELYYIFDRAAIMADGIDIMNRYVYLSREDMLNFKGLTEAVKSLKPKDYNWELNYFSNLLFTAAVVTKCKGSEYEELHDKTTVIRLIPYVYIYSFMDINKMLDLISFFWEIMGPGCTIIKKPKMSI